MTESELKEFCQARSKKWIKNLKKAKREINCNNSLNSTLFARRVLEDLNESRRLLNETQSSLSNYPDWFKKIERDAQKLEDFILGS